jgi:hypothetical protein
MKRRANGWQTMAGFDHQVHNVYKPPGGLVPPVEEPCFKYIKRKG